MFNREKFKEIYPFKSNYFEHKSGIKQHYIDEGEGTPFVMVHGNPSWSFLYRDMVKFFKDKYRCIVPDHVGCGLSEKPAKDKFGYTLKEHTDNLEALIDSLNISEPVNIAVHDWGGAIGIGYAVRHPEKINKIIILNTAAFRLPEGCPFPWPIWAFRHTKIGPEINRHFNAFSFVASLTCSIKGMPSIIKEGFTSPYDSVENRIATTEFVLDIPLKEGDRSYDELIKTENGLSTLNDKPMIICFGRRDFCFNRNFYNEWIKRFPNAERHTYNAGHYLLEDAGEEIFRDISNFLSR